MSDLLPKYDPTGVGRRRSDEETNDPLIADQFPQTHAFRDQAARLSKWLTQEGRFVSGNRELLDQFCARVIETGSSQR